MARKGGKLPDETSARGVFSRIPKIVAFLAAVCGIGGFLFTIFSPSKPGTNSTTYVSNEGPPADHSSILDIISATSSMPTEWRPPFWGLFPFVPSSWNYIVFLDINKLSTSPMSYCVGELRSAEGGYWQLAHILDTSSEHPPDHEPTFQLPEGSGAHHVWVGVVGEHDRIDMHNSTVRIKCNEYITPWRSVDTNVYDRWYKWHPEIKPY
jgi:hypothetical protein